MPSNRRRTLRCAVFTFILIAPLLVGPTSLAADAPAGASNQANDPEAAELRSRFGLSAREAEQRVANRQPRERWIAAMQRNPPPAFAGIRYDVAADVVHVYGKDVQALRSFTRGAPVRTEEHTVALDGGELAGAADAAARALLRTAPYPAAGELSIRPEPTEARVYIDLAEQATAATAQRAERFADGRSHVVVVRNSARAVGPVACGPNACNPPLRAGFANLIYDYPGNGLQCTNGFMVESRADRKPYMLLAAHCQNGWAYNVRWASKFEDNSTHIIGTRWNGKYSDDVDAQIVTINNPFGWQVQPYFLHGTTTYQVTGYFYNWQYYVGMYLCHTGRSTGTKCGYVTNLNGTYGDGYGHSVNNQVMTDACGLSGDSGGPMYQIDNVNQWRKAAGVVTVGRVGVTNCDNPVSGFSRIESVMNALNVDLDTTYNNYV